MVHTVLRMCISVVGEKTYIDKVICRRQKVSVTNFVEKKR